MLPNQLKTYPSIIRKMVSNSWVYRFDAPSFFTRSNGNVKFVKNITMKECMILTSANSPTSGNNNESLRFNPTANEIFQIKNYFDYDNYYSENTFFVRLQLLRTSPLSRIEFCDADSAGAFSQIYYIDNNAAQTANDLRTTNGSTVVDLATNLPVIFFNLVITKEIYNIGSASETNIIRAYVDNVVQNSVITSL